MAMSRTIRGYYLAFLAKPMIALLFLCVIVRAAGIFDAFVPGISQIALGGLCLALAVGLLLCLLNDTPLTALLALAVVGLFVGQHLVFAYNAGVSPNFNAILSYLPIISFVLVRQRVMTMRAMLSMLAWIITFYLALYVFLHQYLIDLGPEKNPAYLVGDQMRAPRVKLLLSFASFVIFYGVMNRRISWVSRALMIGLGVASVVMSGSRTFQLLFVIIFLLFSLRMLGVAARSLIFGLFMLIALTLLSGLFIPWNPMEMFSADNSGLARASEYRYAVEAIHKHWFLGVGLWTDFEAMQTYLQTPRYWPLYPSDLGIMGPYIVLGLTGTLLYIAATYLCIVPRLSKLRTPSLRALRINCILCGAYGIISPAIALESPSFFLAVLVGALLRTHHSRLSQVRATPIYSY